MNLKKCFIYLFIFFFWLVKFWSRPPVSFKCSERHVSHETAFCLFLQAVWKGIQLFIIWL